MQHLKIKLTDRAVTGVLTAISATLRDGRDLLPAESYISENFYRGTEKFLKAPAKNGRWFLGFAEADLTPLDYKTRTYYLGGYMVPTNGFCNKIETVVDDMRARCIALDDGSGRGLSVFCTVDCIGITNADIRDMRKKIAKEFSEAFPKKSLASINICATHTHSCVDTEGLWTDFPAKMHRNARRNRTGKGIPERGADEQYLRFMTGKITETVLNAIRGLCPGKLYLAQKDIGEEYFSNKNRPSATSVVTELTRLVFRPDDRALKPTMIVHLPAHPDTAGLPTSDGQGTGRELCGDYIHYMGETIAKAGYNFMFFNGAICAIYMSRGASNDDQPFSHRYEQSVRYGREVARIALSLTKAEEEVKKDPLLYDPEEIAHDTALAEKSGGHYTLWCKNWQPVSESEVAPFFNIRLREIEVPITNPLIQAAGKLNLAHFTVLRRGKRRYTVVSEIGYLEFGASLRAAMVPGEFCCDLLAGGESLKAEGSISGTPFGLPPLRGIFGSGTIAIGLANDELGYIVPDNDYTLGDPGNHYHEFVSVGKKAGSAVICGFLELNKEYWKKL